MKSFKNITLLLLLSAGILTECRATRYPSKSVNTFASHNSGPESTINDSIPGNLSQDTLAICTFNIQFLGAFRKRDNPALAEVIKDFDIVVIQEMVAPPVSGNYPDGTAFKADPESEKFKDVMMALGFRFLMSEEDTGTGDKIHSNGPATEWYICFYDSAKIELAPDLPHGFLDMDRSNNPDYERVPYAFSFRSRTGGNDFVLISVHLNPGSGEKNFARRKHEIGSISRWIDANNVPEKDFFILGDMNIDDSLELTEVIPEGMVSLNDECRRTNTLVNGVPPRFGAKPYDHIMYVREFSSREIDLNFDCMVINLIPAVKPFWKGPGPFPGEPYVHNIFRQYYSDHHPLLFRLRVLEIDDD